MNKFYITTAIPYVNAKPHVGHALEFVQADTIARYQNLLGNNTVLLSGSDENSLKNVQAAEAAGKDVQTFVNENSLLFQNLAEKLNVHFDFFQKGSNPQHHISSQEFWKKCEESGDIYKKDYRGFYCIGCELFYEKDELNENGECYEHPGKPLQEISESNYFFKLSNYQDRIKDLILSETLKITPLSRKNEMLAFLEKGLQDISISRSNERAKNWGVSVPNDETQKMYVWFDALNIYRSGLGEKYDQLWPADIHVIGKGITRFHAIYWPAFLLSAKLPLPNALFVHGYFTVDGQKMSKSLGNVIDPVSLVDTYGTDALRYYLLSQIPSTDDGDFSEEKLKKVFNADLANGLGNLVSRVAKLCERNNISSFERIDENNQLMDNVMLEVSKFNFSQALFLIWESIRGLDKYINEQRPWQQELNEANKTLSNIVIGITGLNGLLSIAESLKIFLPETAEKILTQFSGEIKSSTSLFPRIS